METMADLGVTGMLEMPPAGTLTGIAKRALPGVETFALKTPDQLDAARDLLRQARRAPSPIDDHPDLADAGLARPRARSTGAEAAEPAPCSRRAPRSATSPASRDAHRGHARRTAATVVEWLVEDGDLVSPGQPLVRLHPEAVHA